MGCFDDSHLDWDGVFSDSHLDWGGVFSDILLHWGGGGGVLDGHLYFFRIVT